MNTGNEGAKLTQIVCFFIASTPKAFLAEFRDADDDPIGQRWLPNSQVKQVVSGNGGYVVSAERGEEIVIEIPQWLLDKPELGDLCREQLLEMDSGGEIGDDGIGDEFNDDIPF